MPRNPVTGKWVWVLWGVIATSYAVQTHYYGKVWRNDLTLYSYAVSRSPYSPSLTLNYGVALVRAGKLNLAELEFIRAWELGKAREDEEVTEGAMENLKMVDKMKRELK